MEKPVRLWYRDRALFRKLVCYDQDAHALSIFAIAPTDGAGFHGVAMPLARAPQPERTLQNFLMTSDVCSAALAIHRAGTVGCLTCRRL